MDLQIKPKEKVSYSHFIPELLLYDLSYGKKRVLFQMTFKNFMLNTWNYNEESVILYHPSSMLERLGWKIDYHKYGVSKQLQDFVKAIENKGFVKKTDSITHKQLMAYNLVRDENGKNQIFYPENKYGIIYNFEFLHLVELHKNKLLPERVNLESLLLVLAFLREKIVLRTASDFNNKKNIKKRPETYVTTIAEIAELLCLSEYSVSKCVDFLDEIGIIYHEQLYRQLDAVDRIVYGRTLFANKYRYIYAKNRGGSLQSDYDYMREVSEAKRQLKPYGEFGKKIPNSSTEIDD